jgi:hypothetical protein
MAEIQEKPKPDNEEEKQEFVPFAKFLKEYPVGTDLNVKAYFRDTRIADYNRYKKCSPVLRLHCGQCGGTRNFDGEWEHYKFINKETRGKDDFLVYTCRDCGQYKKHYCLCGWPIDDDGNGRVIKIGEYPELNIKIPTHLPKLIGDDYPYFIKGLKCEKQGLGVAAYSYYRRVVENQKTRLFGEILKVAEKVKAERKIIQTIQNAMKEVQFSKAIDTMKEGFPESLLIDGHNPFKLLHKALSVGMHKESDENCLELAHDIRIVLTDLSERIKNVLSEKKDLQSAVSSLLKFNQKRKS